MFTEGAGPDPNVGRAGERAPTKEPSTRPLRILLVAPSSLPLLGWSRGNDPSLDVLPAASIGLAVERARAEAFDAVALHSRLLDDPLGIAQLDATLDGTPLLAFGHSCPDSAELDGTLPPDASASAVSELVRSAAQLRRLRQELADAGQESEEHRARFQALVEGNADGIMVVDEAGVVRFVNPMAGRLFGRPVEALVGTPFGHPLVDGETTEVDLLAPGQSPIVVEMRVVHIEWDGLPAHIACLRDVTDRRQAEETARRLIRADAERSAAEEASRRFRFLAEAGATLASSLDDRTTLSELAHMCLDELADWAVVYVVEDDGALTRIEVMHCDPERHEAARRLREQPLDAADCGPIYEVLRSGEPVLAANVGTEQMAALIPNAETRALVEQLGMSSYMLLPLTARNHQLGVLALVNTDSTPFDDGDLTFARSLAARAALAVDNARLYQSARAADQAKSDLIAVISHDLRTPLNSIIGYTDLLDLGVPDPVSEGALEWVRRIRRSTEHQVHLIDQLLTFSRLDAGLAVRTTEVDVPRMLEDLQAMMEPLAAQAGLSLEVEAEPGVVVATDPDPLRQILLNLVSNAVKYTERGGVRVEARRDGTGVVFSVSDTGVGIAPEHRQRIFDPFWQVDPERRRGGTGLGLSIVQRLVRVLGGEISVRSEAGRGSTFTVRLPVRESRPR